MPQKLSQVRIVHLSDLHFGQMHRFRPPRTPADDDPSGEGYPALSEILQKDWAGQTSSAPVVVAITGDVAQKATADEFSEASTFLQELLKSPVFAQQLTKEQIFLVPGNHDVVFTERNMGRRWQPYCTLYQEFFGKAISASNPGMLTVVRTHNADTRLVVAEINCCVYIQEGSPDAQRGQVDVGALTSLRNQLAALNPDDIKPAIKIALVHHHPVLIPVFAEPGRGYDSIINSEIMLQLLRDYGFHLLLHGHKHYPQILTYDAECGWRQPERNPLTIIAGGSVGSTELPRTESNPLNTYNLIDLKWNAAAREGRIRVRTRGLRIYDNRGIGRLPLDWRWEDVHVLDRIFPMKHEYRPPGEYSAVKFAAGSVPATEKARVGIYAKLRGNMPVVEVIPSFEPGQAYEAKVRIEPHTSKHVNREIPQEVIWSAGSKFEMCSCLEAKNPTFSATFGYYGPMLIRARIRFKDNTIADGYVYAHLPIDA